MSVPKAKHRIATVYYNLQQLKIRLYNPGIVFQKNQIVVVVVVVVVVAVVEIVVEVVDIVVAVAVVAVVDVVVVEAVFAAA